MASQGHPSKKAPSGPLLVHFLQPMHSIGSTSIQQKLLAGEVEARRIDVSSIGQYSWQAGEPEQPVQHSLITASHNGFFFRRVLILGLVVDATARYPGERCWKKRLREGRERIRRDEQRREAPGPNGIGGSSGAFP